MANRKLIISGAILASLLFWAWQVSGGGRDSQAIAFSIVTGGLFGYILQRARFCFFCITRDFIDHKDASGLIALVVALMVGTLGYHAVFGLFLPDASVGRMPPDAHIGPVSWVLALAALVFGIGMAISRSCISAHLYRLGEGSIASIPALLGALIGFGLGFITWNPLYLAAIQQGPVVWLPAMLGYGGSAAVQIIALIAIALLLLHQHRAPTPSGSGAGVLAGVIQQRWPAPVAGLAVGFLAVIVYLRVAPLGVTAELGSVSRTVGDQLGLLPTRLQGLDGLAGCATIVKETLLSPNGAFVIAMVLMAFAAALPAGDFKPRLPGLRESGRNLFGGILLGWGAMTAIGCTVGTLLSGIMAAAVSGWIFAVFCLIGVISTWRILQRITP